MRARDSIADPVQRAAENRQADPLGEPSVEKNVIMARPSYTSDAFPRRPRPAEAAVSLSSRCRP